MDKIIYHYTSPEGVLGILQNKTLRFTDCQYLNDRGEFIYIREPFKEAYEKIIQEREEEVADVDKYINSFFELPYEIVGCPQYHNNHSATGLVHFRYYALCASINSDSANMWNYYVKNGAYTGYNLGIDIRFINSWFTDNPHDQIEFIGGRVIYSSNQQVDMIYKKLKHLFIQLDKEIIHANDNFEKDLLRGQFDGRLYNYIHEQKLFFKNPAFSSEEEYRFIIKADIDFRGFINNRIGNEIEGLSVKFRVGESGIITPYIEWNFALDLKRELFTQITLAPMIEADLAEDSFKRFLDSEARRNIQIIQSSIKLRF